MFNNNCVKPRSYIIVSELKWNFSQTNDAPLIYWQLQSDVAGWVADGITDAILSEDEVLKF